MTIVYQDELSTLHHGDALEVMATIPGASIDLVVTDPPYVIGAVSAGSLGSKSGTWADMMNSTAWFRQWYAEVWRILRPDGAMWTFANWRTLPVVMKAAADERIPISSVLVWDKEWIGPGGPVGLRPSYEVVALMPKPDFTIRNRGLPDIWRHKVGSHKGSGHPAEKPVGLVHRIISESVQRPDSLVLDPFVGSGTTVVAARQLNMRAIGIEADDTWSDLAVRRVTATAPPLFTPEPEPRTGDDDVATLL